jgi:hypothetical protein
MYDSAITALEQDESERLLRIPFYVEPRRFTFSVSNLEVGVFTPKDSRDAKRRIYFGMITNGRDEGVFSIDEEDWYKLSAYVNARMNWTDWTI